MDDICKAIIIDDEDWIREGLCEHIDWDRLGIALAGDFSNPADAIEHLKVAEVHIILTDIRMPHMTGIEMLARLQETLPAGSVVGDRYQIVFLTGYDDFQYARSALLFGAVDYLLKPADLGEIEEALARAKQRRVRSRGAADGEMPASDGPPDRAEPISYLLTRAMQIMKERYHEDLQLNHIADDLFVTPNYLSRLFKQDTGLTFLEHLSRIRFDKACELLRKTGSRIYEIGEMTGYRNPRYFSEWFHKQAGLSPVEYRNRHAVE